MGDQECVEDLLLNKDFKSDGTYQEFLRGDFDVKTHVRDVLQNVTIADHLNKLSEGINLVDSELQKQVFRRYEDLICQATGIETLETALSSIASRIHELLSTVERIRGKVVEPYSKLHSQTQLLCRLQSTCDTLRRIIRILRLGKKLQSQVLGDSKELTKAAQNLNELYYICKDVDITGIEVIEKEQRLIQDAKEEVEKQARQMLIRAIETQNQGSVGIALQVFYNLNILQKTISTLISKILEDVKSSIVKSMDVHTLMQSDQASTKTKNSGGPGKAVMPAPGNTAAFRAQLWTSIEKLLDDIHKACAEVHLLQRVLQKKHDPITHVRFIDEVQKNKEHSVIQEFWVLLADLLKSHLKETALANHFIRQALEGEYPKLLRMYNDLCKRLQQLIEAVEFGDSCVGKDSLTSNIKPEEVLKAIFLPFEQAYLARSLSRLFDPVHLMFSSPDTVPSMEEVDGLIRCIMSELNVASVDPGFCCVIANNVHQCINLFCVKCVGQTVTTGEASQVIGPATPGQTKNVALVNLLFYFEKQLVRAVDASLILLPAAKEIVYRSCEHIQSVMTSTTQPLLVSLGDAIESIILTIHNDDYSSNEALEKQDQQCSSYMKELQDFLARAVDAYIAPFHCQDFLMSSLLPLASKCFDMFIRHCTLVRPLGNAGKMRLAADFAQIEMAVTPLYPRLADTGKSYRVLRAFRPMLFQSPDHIVNSTIIGEVIPHSIALHYLFCKAPPELKSPHETAGWSMSRYSQWLDEHPSEKDRLMLIKGALESYVQYTKQKQLKEFAPIYPVMLQLLQAGLNFGKS